MRFGVNGQEYLWNQKRQKKYWSPLNLKWVTENGFEIESIKQLRRFFERAKIERKEGASDVNDY